MNAKEAKELYQKSLDDKEFEENKQIEQILSIIYKEIESRAKNRNSSCSFKLFWYGQKCNYTFSDKMLLPLTYLTSWDEHGVNKQTKHLDKIIKILQDDGYEVKFNQLYNYSIDIEWS